MKIGGPSSAPFAFCISECESETSGTGEKIQMTMIAIVVQ